MKPKHFKEIKIKYVFGQRTDSVMFDNSWELGENLSVTLSNGDLIVIPKGFRTDFSSTPEFLWSILKPFGDFLLAPIVHDFMYRNKYREFQLGTYGARLFADKEMLYISNETNARHWHDRLDNYVRYFLVRIFGWLSYIKTTK